MKRVSLFVLFILVGIMNMNFVEAENITVADLSFYCEHDMKEIAPQELISTYEYFFQDGTKLDISYLNPAMLLLINGRRYETNVGLVNRDNIILAPIVRLSEILGWTVNQVEENNKFIISSNDSKIILEINNKVANINGEEYEMQVSPLIMHDLIYVPLRFVCEIMELNVGYYNSSDIDLIAHSSIITIDSKLDILPISYENAYSYLKNNLESAYNNFEQNYMILYNPDEDLLKNVSSHLRKNINNLKFIEEFSRYYIFEGPYTIYFDKYTNDVYFNIIDISFSELKKIKFDYPRLFEYGYMVN
ncbi:copper amine oxidase N-terminal domain-containing protein [Tissierella praeacuta]|uniref:copper amine oxidase N-terminal domain-containing protein n=1 Tax=Tissierella praeacuta TaxID=43131 RepID=UPI003341E89F